MAAKLSVKDKKSNEAGSKKGNIVTATNGQKYVQEKNGKVKKLHSLDDLSKLDIDIMSDYKKMTVDLYRFVKDKEAGNKLVSPIYKDGWLLFRDFKVKYSSAGVTIIDVKNFGKNVKHGLEALPTAEEVYEIIKVSKIDKEVINRKKAEKEIKVNQLVQRLNKELKHTNATIKLLDKDAKVLYQRLQEDTSISPELKEEFITKLLDKYPRIAPTETIDVTNLRTKALAMCKRSKDVDKLIDKLTRYIPNRMFNNNFGRLVKKFRDREIRKASFMDELTTLLKDDEVFMERKPKAPKFAPKPIFYIDEILEETPTHIIFRNDKTGDYTVAKSEILLRDLLYTEPRFHVAIHKFINKELTIQDITKTPFQFDRTVCLEYSLLKEHSEELYEWAENLLFDYGSLNPLDIIYRNDMQFQIGDKLQVKFAGLCKKDNVQVIKYENGWKVRSEDGSTDWLYKGQTFKKLN